LNVERSMMMTVEKALPDCGWHDCHGTVPPRKAARKYGIGRRDTYNRQSSFRAFRRLRHSCTHLLTIVRTASSTVCACAAAPRSTLLPERPRHRRADRDQAHHFRGAVVVRGRPFTPADRG
jgi:hypothetical protein